MKLYELREAMRKAKQGTYAGVKFDDATKQSLVDYMNEANIPNMMDKDKLHTTLLYSRVHCPNYKPAGQINYQGTPGKFVVWNTQSPNGEGTSRCLVLMYDCPELSDRHTALREQHGATHDYDQFNPHITLSYDIGNTPLDAFPDIRKHLDTINIVEEYEEPLDISWCKKHT